MTTKLLCSGSIRTRVIAIFAATLLFAAIVVAGGVYQMIWVKDKLANEHYGATYEVQHLLALRGMLAITTAEMLLLLTVNSRNDREPSLGQEVLRDTENRISEIFSVLLQNGYGMTEKYLDNLVALEEIWSEFLAVRYKDVY